jgi:succinate dehydrogenase/fumarate reductase flavoprotein subunit
VVGAIGLGLVDGKTYVFNAKAVIIANGSCRFQSMKEMNWNLGEGMTMAFQAGAQVANAEFRSFYIGSAKQLAGKELMGIDPSFFPLYMENALGERIMEKHYPELVVGKKPGETRGDISLLNDVMFREAEAGYGPIYFDIGKLNLPPEDMKRLKARPRLGFPPLYAWDSLRLLKDKLGIDPDKEKIEIAPVFGGGQGSIRINLDCGTTVEGLWAIGDAASLGSGFAAPSLMAGGFGIGFAAVSGFIAGQSTGEYAAGNKRLEIETGEAERVKARAFAPLGRGGDVAVADVMHQVHEAVVPMKYNFKREAGRLKEALGIIQKAKENLSRVGARDYHELARYHQAESMALAGELTYKAALMREETRGQHRREDFPDRDDKNWLKWIVIEQKDGEPYLSTEPVPSAK